MTPYYPPLGSGGAGVTAHSALTGLTGADHPQYEGFWTRVMSTHIPINSASNSFAPTANQGYLVRALCNRTGFARDFNSFVTATVVGNIELGLYDTGDASPTNYSKIWSSGAVTIVGSNTKQAADPGAGVCPVVAGRQYMFYIGTDAAPTISKSTSPSASDLATLPANFNPVAGGLGLLEFGRITGGTAYPAQATFATANVGITTNKPLVYCRISDT